MKKFFSLGLIFWLGAILLACGPYRAGVNESPLQEKEKIVLLDYALTRYLNIVKYSSNKLETGQLTVKLEMENEERKDVWADVKVVFRGADGFEVENTNWQPVLFHGHTVTPFSQTSLSSNAVDYRILIRNVK